MGGRSPLPPPQPLPLFLPSFWNVSVTPRNPINGLQATSCKRHPCLANEGERTHNLPLSCCNASAIPGNPIKDPCSIFVHVLQIEGTASPTSPLFGAPHDPSAILQCKQKLPFFALTACHGHVLEALPEPQMLQFIPGSVVV